MHVDRSLLRDLARQDRDPARRPEVLTRLQEILRSEGGLEGRLEILRMWYALPEVDPSRGPDLGDVVAGVSEVELLAGVRRRIASPTPSVIAEGLRLAHIALTSSTSEELAPAILAHLSARDEGVAHDAATALLALADVAPDRVREAYPRLWTSRSAKERVAAIRLLATRVGRSDLRANLERVLPTLLAAGSGERYVLGVFANAVSTWESPTREEVEGVARVLAKVEAEERLDRDARRMATAHAHDILSKLRSKGIDEDRLAPLARPFGATRVS